MRGEGVGVVSEPDLKALLLSIAMLACVECRKEMKANQVSERHTFA